MSAQEDKSVKARRVVVTGLGAVTPLGSSAEETWLNLLKGKSGVRRISLFDASEFPVKIAGEVRKDIEEWHRLFPGLEASFRGTFFALAAAEEALESAGLKDGKFDPDSLGLYFGAGDSGNDFAGFSRTVAAAADAEGNVDEGLYVKESASLLDGLREIESQPFMTVAHLASRFGLSGPVSNCLTACAASSQAIGEAFEWIRRGDVPLVMTGGSHSMVYELGVAGFSLLTALSKRNDEPEKACRPFEKGRSGFVLSEGAGVLILEELEHALQRGAPIYGEITGYGSTADAYRMTDMDPEGLGAARAMTIAMNKAGIRPSKVDYISAHGTGTQVNDLIETRAVRRAMGEYAFQTPVSSIKSMLGHSIAAAGAVELIACLLAIRDGMLPPTINYEVPDPACDLDYVPNRAREKKVETVLSNSFGFGGQNICLAVKKWKPN